MNPKFVYVRSLKGPEPQIWHTGIATRDLRPVPTLMEREITPEESEMTLDALSEKYPFKLEKK